MELSHAKCPSCREQGFSYDTKKQRGFCYACGKYYAEENMDKDLGDEGFQLTHPDLNNTDNIVVKPSHYTQYNIEPVTFIMENRLSFEIGNIVKYACRAGHKMYPDQDYKQSRITDLRKVMRYAEMEINRLEGKEVL